MTLLLAKHTWVVESRLCLSCSVLMVQRVVLLHIFFYAKIYMEKENYVSNEFCFSNNLTSTLVMHKACVYVHMCVNDSDNYEQITLVSGVSSLLIQNQ